MNYNKQDDFILYIVNGIKYYCPNINITTINNMISLSDSDFILIIIKDNNKVYLKSMIKSLVDNYVLVNDDKIYSFNDKYGKIFNEYDMNDEDKFIKINKDKEIGIFLTPYLVSKKEKMSNDLINAIKNLQTVLPSHLVYKVEDDEYTKLFPEYLIKQINIITAHYKYHLNSSIISNIKKYYYIKSYHHDNNIPYDDKIGNNTIDVIIPAPSNIQ